MPKYFLSCIFWIAFMFLWVMTQSFASNQSKPPEETFYIQVEPFIVTNYLKKDGRFGFINVEPSIVVKGQEAKTLVNDNMPMIMDSIIFLLSSYDEATLTDFTQRDNIRNQAKQNLQALFTKEVGKPIVDNVLFIKYITQ